MTDPSQFDKDANGWTPSSDYPPPLPNYQQPNYPPPPANYPPPYGYPPQAPGYGAPAGHGFHPVSGEPLSDKSKMIAGLLQLLGLLGILGVGRMYMGQTTFGILQLVGCLAFGVITCGFGFIVPFVWGIVDAVILMTGSPRDQHGRLLRDGT